MVLIVQNCTFMKALSRHTMLFRVLRGTKEQRTKKMNSKQRGGKRVLLAARNRIA